MRRILTPILLILGLSIGLVYAQNVTKSVQLSQDPSGPIGFDTLLNTYFQGHILITPSVRPVPTITSCGTGSPTVAGTDVAGKITTGSGASTSCVLTFGTAYVTAPACQLSTAVTNAGPLFLATTTTTATFNYASATSLIIAYNCMSSS